jgi:23S rRNA (cytosine1962-C5)-methyltransferase
MLSNSYELVDSGEGGRLERFGDRLLVRPSSHAIWQRRLKTDWTRPFAVYSEDGTWRLSNPSASRSWTIQAEGYTKSLTLLDNGQVGLFPEHASYLKELREEILGLKIDDKEVSLLNLFAYTGMCSCVAAKAGAMVTHVDTSKPILDWANDDFAKNGISNVRLIKEDALSFMRKELRRGKKYNFIVVDPPGFSRSKDFSWKIEEIIKELVHLVGGLLGGEGGSAYVTFHGSEFHPETVRNLLLDNNLNPDCVSVRPLNLRDRAGRCLPSGALIKVTTKSLILRDPLRRVSSAG